MAESQHTPNPSGAKPAGALENLIAAAENWRDIEAGSPAIDAACGDLANAVDAFRAAGAGAKPSATSPIEALKVIKSAMVARRSGYLRRPWQIDPNQALALTDSEIEALAGAALAEPTTTTRLNPDTGEVELSEATERKIDAIFAKAARPSLNPIDYEAALDKIEAIGRTLSFIAGAIEGGMQADRLTLGDLSYRLFDLRREFGKLSGFDELVNTGRAA